MDPYASPSSGDTTPPPDAPSPAASAAFVSLQPAAAAALAARRDGPALAVALTTLARVAEERAASLRRAPAVAEFALAPALAAVDAAASAATGAVPPAETLAPGAATSDAAATAAVTAAAVLLRAAGPPRGAGAADAVARLAALAAIPRTPTNEETRAAAVTAVAAALIWRRAGRELAACPPALALAASSLLGAAAAEASAGAVGSRDLRASALATLRLLIRRVAASSSPGGGDAIAAVLPGVASGAAAALAASTAAASGGAAGSAGVAAAAGLLADVIVAALAGCGAVEAEGGDGDAVAQLRRMAERGSTATPPPPPPPPQQTHPPAGPTCLPTPPIRDATWAAATRDRCGALAARAVPPLAALPSVRARRAAARSAARITAALGARDALLDTLLALAADPDPCVAAEAVAGLSACGGSDAAAATAAVPRLAAELATATGTPGIAGALAARRLASALATPPPGAVAAAVLAPPAVCRALLAALRDALTPVAGLVCVLLHEPPDAGVYLPPPAAVVEQQQGDSAATPPPPDLDSATAAAPSLPRAPLGAPCSGDEYAAIAAAARAAGAAAARAGGAPLRALVESAVADFSSRLPRQQGGGGSLQPTTTDPHWALGAAGCAALLGEVVAGAATVRACASPSLPPPSDLEPALDAVVNAVLDALASSAVWCLPLDEDDASTTSLAARSAAAALARAAAETMGTLLASRSHGALRGATMRRGLLPLLDARGRSVPAVASGAAAALAAAAAADGRASVRALVVAHADYVVDGVCARLRGSTGGADGTAGAASLCAAALRATGAAPDLLPLLAEPARAAVRGLAPGARRRAPTVIAPLLDALAELCVAAGADAASVMVEEAAARAAAEAVFEAANPPPPDDTADSTPGAGVAFFQDRVRARLEPGLALADSTPPTLPERPRREWDAAATRRARAAAAAAIADAAADVAAPVLQAASLALVPAAERALGAALTALACAAAVADAADSGDRCVAPRRDPAPPPPPAPTLLPAVHRAWSPAVAALADPRGPVAAAGARSVALLARVGGAAFLARRFADDAWPRLALLLARGSAAEGAPDVAPGAARTARLAALGCVAAAGDAVAPVAHAAAAAALPLLADGEPADVREAAAGAMLAVATVDADAVWCALAPVAAGSAITGGEPPPAGLPPAADVLPRHTGALPAGCSARAASLLTRVEAVPVRWHASVERLG